ncbi:mucin-2 [Biomphalaria pfeifferi]|uniref:Mucin-2 n=1 Tax=Biomphalaria pfeifferi TaxID=112525 RepID=A0AAD8AY73_BIOPF|nr:mucin-2 [Biomphalaria pfeifferi]
MHPTPGMIATPLEATNFLCCCCRRQNVLPTLLRMTAEYNLPLHVNSQNGDDYVIEDGYPHDGVTPPGMAWDGQGDGGGKFRLKRRRRCGQCGPCQVIVH